MIAAIETNYAGQLFRSKLEARWAFFFDRCGVKWKYEYEGFALPSGNYLPDFYLPGPNRFLEIKPEFMRPSDRWRAYQLLKELWAETGVECWLAQGEPVDNFVRGFGDGIELSRWGHQRLWCGEPANITSDEDGNEWMHFHRPEFSFIDGDILYAEDFTQADPSSLSVHEEWISVPLMEDQLDVPWFVSSTSSRVPSWLRDRGVTQEQACRLLKSYFDARPELSAITKTPMIFHGCNFMSTYTGQLIKPAADAAAAAFRFNHKARV